MPYLKAFPHTLRPVRLSREAGVLAVAGEEEGLGRMTAMPGTIPVINQQHILQHHTSHHTQPKHARDTMEILLHIEGKVMRFVQEALKSKHVNNYSLMLTSSMFCFVLSFSRSGSSRGRKYYSGGGGSSSSSGSGTSSCPVVYSDGCCYNNGFQGACGGIGVYWGDGSSL